MICNSRLEVNVIVAVAIANISIAVSGLVFPAAIMKLLAPAISTMDTLPALPLQSLFPVYPTMESGFPPHNLEPIHDFHSNNHKEIQNPVRLAGKG